MTIVGRSTKKTATGLALGVGLIAVCVGGIVRAWARAGGPVAVVLTIVLAGCLLCFLPVAAYLSYKLVVPRPVLVLDAGGLWDHSLGGVGKLSWDEIAAVEIKYTSGIPFLSVRAKNPQAVIARQHSSCKRWLLQRDVRKGWGVTNVTGAALAVDLEVVVAEIQARIGVVTTR